MKRGTPQIRKMKILFNKRIFDNEYNYLETEGLKVLVNSRKEFVNLNNSTTNTEYYVLNNSKRHFFNLGNINFKDTTEDKFSIDIDELLTKSDNVLGDSQFDFIDITDHLTTIEFVNNEQKGKINKKWKGMVLPIE